MVWFLSKSLFENVDGLPRKLLYKRKWKKSTKNCRAAAAAVRSAMVSISYFILHTDALDFFVTCVVKNLCGSIFLV